MDNETNKEKPQKDYGPDMGHEWDGIRELKNPPPRWWMIGLHASWIFVAGYLLLYPSIPLVNSSTKGLLGWTQVKEYKESLAENEEIKAPYLLKINEMSPKEILADSQMRNFSQQSTKAIFGDLCSGCHGMGGEGKAGLYPNLGDDDWLYGGDIESIIETITDGRESYMPAQIDLQDEKTIELLADFVMAPVKSKASKEAQKAYATSGCPACHGSDARGALLNGNPSLGAANLTDKIWRFGGTREEVLQTIRYGVNEDLETYPNTRTAVMPAWGERLSEAQIKMLAIRVFSLGGGQSE